MPTRSESLPDVAVRRARIGRGLFATRPIRRGRDIMRIDGRIVPADLLWDRGGTFADNCYRFGPETYLDPGDSPGRFVNHSCDPNAGVRKERNRLFLFAARAIRAREEIVIDYATILGDDDIWTMRCRCGSPMCRGRVKRVGALPHDVLERYRALGLIPRFILATLGNIPR
jgi:hypothetical protein